MKNTDDLEVTQYLNNERDNPSALGEVYAVLYRDIKNVARYHLNKLPSGATITPTVLAHEAYERIYHAMPKNYQDRTHFLRTLGRVMRNYLIDEMRAKGALKKGQKDSEQTISGFVGEQDISYDMMAFDQALVFISEIDPSHTEILELRLLFGFTFEEAADILKISSRQAMRRWNQAKAMLVSVLSEQN